MGEGAFDLLKTGYSRAAKRETAWTRSCRFAVNFIDPSGSRRVMDPAAASIGYRAKVATGGVIYDFERIARRRN